MSDTAALRLACAELFVLRSKVAAFQDEAPEPSKADVDDVVREKRDEATGFGSEEA